MKRQPWRFMGHAIQRLPDSQRANEFFLALICLAVFLSAVFISPRVFDHVTFDFRFGYYPGALGIQSGLGYVDPDGKLITGWSPGYSLLIAPFVTDDLDETLNRLRWVSGAAVLAWALILRRLIRRLIPEVPSYLPLAFATLWPPMLAIGNPAYSEFALALTSAGACLLLSRITLYAQVTLMSVLHAASAGLLLAAAMLVKVSALAVAVFGLLHVGRAMRNVALSVRMTHIAIAVAVMTAGILPWVLTFKSHTGHIGFTSTSARAAWDGLSRFPHLSVGQCIPKRLPGMGPVQAGTIEYLKRCAEHPLSALHMFAVKSLRTWYGMDSRRLEWILALLNLPWSALLLFSVARWLRQPREDRAAIGMLLGIVLALWAMIIVALVSIFRYMAPFFPFAVIVVFWALFNDYGQTRREVETRPLTPGMGESHLR